MKDLAYEIAINAFEHGRAGTFGIKVEKDRIIFTDDGIPLTIPDCWKMKEMEVRLQWNMLLGYLRLLIDMMKKYFRIIYARGVRTIHK